MTRDQRLKFYSLLVAAIGLLALLALFPIAAKAADPIKGVADVLKDPTDATNQQVIKIWQQALNLVNSFVVIILIVMAFATILKLKIDTYGFKKILPSLILAVIAANFSFLLCRFLIDLANVALDALLRGPGGRQNINTAIFNGLGNTLKGTIDLGSAKGVFWFIVAQFLKIIGAILVLILAFMFLIRNWLLYFLVAISPMAFMATVLPQTKSVFSQWWSNFFKWTFMPVVSIFWLWIGAQWFNVMDNGAFLMSYVLTAACFVLAITTPMKMGGAVMQRWHDFGKKAWGATGGKFADNIKQTTTNRVNAAWTLRSAQITKALSNKPIIGRFVGARQKSEYALKSAQAYRGALDESLGAKEVSRQGRRGYELREEIQTMKGDIEATEKLEQLNVLKSGLRAPQKPKMPREPMDKDNQEAMGEYESQMEQYRADLQNYEQQTNEYRTKNRGLFTSYERVKGMREKSAKYIAMLETAETLRDNLNAESMMNFFYGGPLLGTDEEKQEYLEKIGLTPQQYQDFMSIYSETLVRKSEASEAVEKAKKDALNKAEERRVAIDQIAEMSEAAKSFSQSAKKLVEADNEMLKVFKKIEQGKESELADNEKGIYDKYHGQYYSDYIQKKTAAVDRLREMGLLHADEDIIDDDGKIRDDVMTRKDNAIAEKKVLIKKEINANNNTVPSLYGDIVKQDAEGDVEFVPMPNIIRSRSRKIVNAKISGDISDNLAQFSPEALISSVQNGNMLENVAYDSAGKFIRGIPIDPTEARKLSGWWGAVLTNLASKPEASEPTANGILNIFAKQPELIKSVAAEIIAKESAANKREATFSKIGEVYQNGEGDTKKIRDAIMEHYRAVGTNQRRTTMNGVLRRFAPRPRV